MVAALRSVMLTGCATPLLAPAGVQQPQVNYGPLMSALQESCAELGLQPVAPFLTKVVQLYETTVVRHGLMLVGLTMSGKTCCYKVLQVGGGGGVLGGSTRKAATQPGCGNS